MEEHLTPYDIAKILNISSTAAYNLCGEPNFPAFKVRDGKASSWRVSKQDFECWLEERKSMKKERAKVIRRSATHNTKQSAKPADNVYKLNWG
ncbi:MAG: helix-turn-helix domain-containing protein [Syntrophomonas sp.]